MSLTLSGISGDDVTAGGGAGSYLLLEDGSKLLLESSGALLLEA